MSTPAVSNVKGTGYQHVQLPTKDPRAMQLYQQVAQALGPHLSGAIQGIGQMAAGGTPEQWEQLEAPALRQFGQLQGNIASRFSGMGSGARHSSGFQNTMSGAAADLAERLQGQRLGLQQNALSQLFELYQNLVGTDTFENLFIEKRRKNPWGGLIEGAGSGALAGSTFGPWGTAIGALLGGSGGYFGGR